ncbi:intermediate filament protein ON3-like [Girardinichthys multiradiatus]|uniref:intermediate filament protein ON3-like n=1 Tax=Girardinichthys multiradiatus TaxID=208333 RepID=UPI001FACFB0D|nr:intermediate filament protein ON3-like [Girardinichthys multiradiatus]
MSFSSKTCEPIKERVMSKPNGKADSAGKFVEKDQMVGLNDKFVKLIDKVKNLEDEKKILETKLKILKGQEDYSGNVNAIVKQEKNDLQEKIDNLKRDQEKLKDELEDTQKEVEDAKKSYEDEVTKRTDLEYDFIISKKELDKSHLDLVEDVLELEDLTRKLQFLRAGFDEEIKELESMVKNETVIIPSPNKRSLDVTEYVKTIENQYANMASHGRVEAEQWNQRKIESLVQSAGQKEQAVRDIKREISDILRQIQRLSGDLDGLKRKEESLKNEIDETRKDGEGEVEEARRHIKLLEDNLKSHKQELARQIRQHQELLNLKLALDIEIATYRQLLMGEEQRMDNLQGSDF